MPERIDQPGQQDSPRTAAQLLAVQILTRTAEHLDDIDPLTHPITGGAEPRCMTDGWRTIALNQAMGTVLDTVPSKYQRSAARRAVLMALPPIAGTTVEYAARVRELAVAA